MKKVLAILTIILMMVMVFPASALTEEAVEEPQEVQEIVIPDKLTVHIVGFIKAGKLVTGASMDLVKGQSKLISGFINKVGGKITDQRITVRCIHSLTDSYSQMRTAA